MDVRSIQVTAVMKVALESNGSVPPVDGFHLELGLALGVIERFPPPDANDGATLFRRDVRRVEVAVVPVNALEPDPVRTRHHLDVEPRL